MPNLIGSTDTVVIYLRVYQAPVACHSLKNRRDACIIVASEGSMHDTIFSPKCSRDYFMTCIMVYKVPHCAPWTVRGGRGGGGGGGGRVLSSGGGGGGGELLP